MSISSIKGFKPQTLSQGNFAEAMNRLRRASEEIKSHNRRLDVAVQFSKDTLERLGVSSKNFVG